MDVRLFFRFASGTKGKAIINKPDNLLSKKGFIEALVRKSIEHCWLSKNILNYFSTHNLNCHLSFRKPLGFVPQNQVPSAWGLDRFEKTLYQRQRVETGPNFKQIKRM